MFYNNPQERDFVAIGEYKINSNTKVKAKVKYITNYSNNN